MLEDKKEATDVTIDGLTLDTFKKNHLQKFLTTLESHTPTLLQTPTQLLANFDFFGKEQAEEEDGGEEESTSGTTASSSSSSSPSTPTVVNKSLNTTGKNLPATPPPLVKQVPKYRNRQTQNYREPPILVLVLIIIILALCVTPVMVFIRFGIQIVKVLLTTLAVGIAWNKVEGKRNTRIYYTLLTCIISFGVIWGDIPLAIQLLLLFVGIPMIYPKKYLYSMHILVGSLVVYLAVYLLHFIVGPMSIVLAGMFSIVAMIQTRPSKEMVRTQLVRQLESFEKNQSGNRRFSLGKVSNFFQNKVLAAMNSVQFEGKEYVILTVGTAPLYPEFIAIGVCGFVLVAPLLIDDSVNN